MNIGEIGTFFNTTTKIEYYSDTALLEYDALIINFNSLLKHAQISNFDTKKIFLKRKQDLEDFIKLKNIPIIYITPTPRDIYLTSANVQKVTFDFVTPIPNISVVNETGKKLEFIPNTIFTEFFKKYESHFNYIAYFETRLGNVIAETHLSKKNLSFYTDECIFLPQVTKFTNIEKEKEFLLELIEIVKNIHKGNEVSILPEWANNFYLPKEESLVNEIEVITQKIHSLKLTLEKKEQEIIEYSTIKKLFTSSGDELENEVKNIFKAIGFELLETKQNREDLILKYNEKIAVVEVKGVNKSAGEKHAAQLEKWVSNYLEDNEVRPKGILVVNSFKDTPINERNEPTFPDQMIKYSTQREHCLLTTLQLIALYYSIIDGPDKKENIINSIFSTIGIYSYEDGWEKYITRKINI